jgi:hypothetical protein
MTYKVKQNMYMKLSTVIALVAFFLVNVFSISVHAESAGKVVFSIGKIHAVSANGKKRILKRGSKISSGDTVVTNRRAMLQMRMVDKGFIALRGNSKFKIDKFVYKKDMKKDKSNFSLLRGGIRAVTGFIGKRNRAAYKVKTISATIGIRGTDFTARLCNNDCGGAGGSGDGNGLYVGVTKGGVTLTNDAGTLELNPQQNGFVAGKRAVPKALARAPKLLFFKSRKPGEEMGDDDDDKEAGKKDGKREGGKDRRRGGQGDGKEPSGENMPPKPPLGEDGDNSPGDDGAKPPLPDGNEGEGEVIQPTVIVPEDRNAPELIPNAPLPLNPTNPVPEFMPPEIPFDTRKVAMATGPIGTDLHFTRANLVVVDSVNLASSGVASFNVLDAEGKNIELSKGTANNIDVGRDPNTGVMWGRWGAGIAGIKPEGGTATAIDLNNSSLHWVVDATPTDNIVLPKTGTFNFDLIGNTPPTDNLGHSGILGNATITADFLANTVNTQIDVGINGQVWNATGTGAAINSNGIFNSNLSVNVNTGATNISGQGSASGFFTNNAAGAGMGYSMDANVGGTPTTVSGAAAFRQRP